MIFANKARVLGCCFILFVVSSVAFSADWPQWRGPNRDGATVDVPLPAVWPTELMAIWQQKELGEGCSSPVVVGDRIYVHYRQKLDEVVSCLSLSSGEKIWSGRYPSPWTPKPSAGDDRGPHSTPAIKDGSVFTLGINGVLTCWNAQHGAVKWRWSPPAGSENAIPGYGAALSPLVADGLVFAHGSGEKQTALAAFDAVTGKMKWAWHGAPPAYSSPIMVNMAGQRQLVFMTESSLAGLSPIDGKVLWTRQLRPRNSYENIITPVVYRDLLIYAQTGYPEIMALRLVRNGDHIQTQDVWANREHPLDQCTPVIAGDLLLGTSHLRSGHVFCLDAATGKTRWRTEDGVQSEVPLINLGSAVLVVTKGIRISVLRPNAQRFDPIVEWQGPVAGIVAGPVFLGNRLLLWDSQALILFGLGKS